MARRGCYWLLGVGRYKGAAYYLMNKTASYNKELSDLNANIVIVKKPALVAEN